MKRITAAVLAAFALISCRSTDSQARPPAAPALWKLADKDTTIYLFGTIHLLPEDLEWQTPKLKAAIARSQSLVLETVVAKDPSATARILGQIGLSPNLPPLTERVPAEKRTALAEAISRSGQPAAVLDKFETWAAALMLAQQSFQKLDVSPQYGAEPVLSGLFTAAKKPIFGLETPAQQLGYFDSLPEDAQRIFLESITEDDSQMQKQFDAMIAAWSTGDTAKIALTFDDELKISKALTEVLLRQRNRQWVTWIARRMNKPGTVFLAVGAGHLAGTDSVNALLAARGLKLIRVQ
jgi:uncharacterized protein